MKIAVADLDFELLIPYGQLEKRTKELAKQIGEDYEGRSPIIAGILTGSFLLTP
jgi:hypoxanthine-guanine phosphoribosyltransferase